MTADGKVTATVWGGQLDGHTFTERPPAFRIAIQRRLVVEADHDPAGDAQYATFELVPWADHAAGTHEYRWVPADIAERLRQGSTDA